MPREEGVVLKVLSEGALVCVTKTEACHGCPSAQLCHMGKTGEREVLAQNPVGAKEGQRVEIEIKDGLFLQASFIIYIFPVIALILGAIFGRWISRVIQISLSEDTCAVIGGLICMISVFILIKLRSCNRYYMKKFQPTIIKIK